MTWCTVWGCTKSATLPLAVELLEHLGDAAQVDLRHAVALHPLAAERLRRGPALCRVDVEQPADDLLRVVGDAAPGV